MNRGMVGAQSVLVVAIIDGDLDADTSINETNDCGWDTNEIGVPTVGGTCEAVKQGQLRGR